MGHTELISKVLFEQSRMMIGAKKLGLLLKDAGKAPGTKYHTLFTDVEF
mgnify:CR=1 FL=1